MMKDSCSVSCVFHCFILCSPYILYSPVYIIFPLPHFHYLYFWLCCYRSFKFEPFRDVSLTLASQARTGGAKSESRSSGGPSPKRPRQLDIEGESADTSTSADHSPSSRGRGRGRLESGGDPGLEEVSGLLRAVEEEQNDLIGNGGRRDGVDDIEDEPELPEGNTHPLIV